MRDTVWGWITTGKIEARVAVQDIRLIGLAHFRSFLRPLSASTGGYLDDLFVDPAARGFGAAEALIAAARTEAAARGWSVVRWITSEDNHRARSVYDKVAQKTVWVTYDVKP
jgi:GNAT superfamily N-acetyltransferase